MTDNMVRIFFVSPVVLGYLFISPQTLADTFPAGYDLIRDDGVDEPRRGAINFIGAGVSCADDNSNNETECTISGGGTPGGTGTEIQFRSGASTFGAVTNSAVSGANISVGAAVVTPSVPLHAVITDGTLPVLLSGVGILVEASATNTDDAFIQTIAGQGTISSAFAGINFGNSTEDLVGAIWVTQGLSPEMRFIIEADTVGEMVLNKRGLSVNPEPDGLSTTPALDLHPNDTADVLSEQIILLTDAVTYTINSGSTIPAMRSVLHTAPVINGVAGGAAETVTDAATLYVSGAPSGSDITFTNGPFVALFDGSKGGTSSVQIQGTNPTFVLRDTDAGSKSFEWNVNGSSMFIANTTDNVQLLAAGPNNAVYLPQTLSCAMGLTTTADGKILCAPSRETCGTIENLAAADDNIPFGSLAHAGTINTLWCHCVGTCTTPATITLEDGAGNAMTGTATCGASSASPSATTISAGGTVAARELIRFDVTNTPSPDATDDYNLCYSYTYT